jgi:ribosomal-protein-alanine N-acetyltransferase
MEIEDIYGDLPTIETERLRLRKFHKDDAAAIYDYASNEQVTKYVLWETHQSIKDSEAFLAFALNKYDERDVSPWAIELKRNERMIGTVDFVWWKPKDKTAELGYVLSEPYWGQGIMTEAVNALVEFGFNNMELERIQAKCIAENLSSARVMEKAGLIYEGTHRRAIYVKGAHRDFKVYAIIREDYEQKHQPLVRTRS